MVIILKLERERGIEREREREIEREIEREREKERNGIVQESILVHFRHGHLHFRCLIFRPKRTII